MRARHKIFEALKNTPEGLRFCRTWDKRAKYPENQYQNPFTLEEVLEMEGNGVGVLLGRHSTTTINGKKYGLGAIDFDGTDSDLTFEHHVGFDPAALTKTVTVTSGKKDRKQMFYWIPEEYLDVLKKGEYKHEGWANFELRIGDHYSMVAGAHDEMPEGYYWINSPADTDIAIAPLLLLEGWEELSKDRQPKKSFITYRRSQADLQHDSSRVKRYLERYYSPPIDWATPREEWIKVVQALRCLSQEWEECTGIKDKHLDDAHYWCSQMGDYYDPKGLDKCWYSFKRSPSENNVVRINTFFGNAKKHPNWERDQEILNKENEERPKRKKTELLNDIFEAALRGDEDSYAEDFAEMEFRFRRKSNDIAIDLLKLLRDKFTNKVYSVGEVDMTKVKSLEYLLQGYAIKGEVGVLFAPYSTGKTSLACGMVKSGFNGVGFLDEIRKRDKFESLIIMSDGGANRFKEVYDELKLSPEMVSVWASDNQQAITNWKCDLRGLIKLHKYLKANPQKKLIIIDSVISMLSGTPFAYTNNNEVDLIVDFLRSIICEPLGVSIMLLSHLSTDKQGSSGAKRWVGAAGWVAEIRSITVNENEDFTKRKLLIRKDPINGKRVFDYKVNENGIFVPVYNSDMKGDCFGELKQFIQQLNYATGRKVFEKKEFYAIKYSVSQVDKQTKAHCTERDGILKRVSQGKYELKSKYILLNDDSKGQKQAADWDFWKN